MLEFFLPLLNIYLSTRELNKSAETYYKQLVK